MRKAIVAVVGLGLVGILTAPVQGQKKENIPALVKKLQSPFSSDVTAAARSLGRLGPEAREAVPALAEALRKAGFADERMAIIACLGQIGPAAQDAVPAMAEALRKASSSSEKAAIVRTLGQMGPAAKGVVPALAEILKRGFAEEQKAAAEALGQMGPAAKEAVPALTEAARSGFLSVRPAAEAALKKITSREARTGIRDDGRFFSADGVRKASEEVQEIVARYKVDLLIETYPGVPTRQIARVTKMNAEERAKFFQEWAGERSQTVGVEGVYILVCREPSYFQFEVTGSARAVFDNRTRDKLRDLLLTEFREKRFDDGLLTSLGFIRGRLAAAPPK